MSVSMSTATASIVAADFITIAALVITIGIPLSHVATLRSHFWFKICHKSASKSAPGSVMRHKAARYVAVATAAWAKAEAADLRDEAKQQIKEP